MPFGAVTSPSVKDATASIGIRLAIECFVTMWRIANDKSCEKRDCPKIVYYDVAHD